MKNKHNVSKFDPTEDRHTVERVGKVDVHRYERGKVLDSDGARYVRGEQDQNRPSPPLPGNLHASDSD